MPKKKHFIPENLSSSQLLSKHKTQINKNWSYQQDWTNHHNRGLIHRANKSIFLPYNNVSPIETINVKVSLQIDKNKILIYFSNLNVDKIPNPVLYLFTNKKYHFQIMDPRISLFLTEQKNEHFFNLSDSTNNPLENTQQRLTFNTRKVLNGCYIITTSLFAKSINDNTDIYTVSAGNKIFVNSQNYNRNYQMFRSPGYNLFINFKSNLTSFGGLVNEVFGQIKKELPKPKYYYGEVGSKLYRFLYNPDNRLNFITFLYNFDFFSEIRLTEVFPNYQYLTNTKIDNLLKGFDLQHFFSKLPVQDKLFLIRFFNFHSIPTNFKQIKPK